MINVIKHLKQIDSQIMLKVIIFILLICCFHLTAPECVAMAIGLILGKL